MTIPILMQIVLAIMVFLISLNDCLQGSGKSKLRKILFTLHLFVVIAAFAVFGWKWGLISLATIFVCALLFARVTTRIAVGILGPRSSPELMQRYTQLFQQDQTLISDKQLEQLLQEHGLKPEDIEVWPTIFQEEWDLAIRDHDTMRYLLSLIQAGENQMVIAAKLRQRCLGSIA